MSSKIKPLCVLYKYYVLGVANYEILIVCTVVPVPLYCHVEYLCWFKSIIKIKNSTTVPVQRTSTIGQTQLQFWSVGFNSCTGTVVLVWFSDLQNIFPHLFYFIYETSYFYDLNDHFRVRMQKVVQFI